MVKKTDSGALTYMNMFNLFKKKELPKTQNIGFQYMYGMYLERFLEAKYEKDIKKLNRKVTLAVRYKYKDMIKTIPHIKGWTISVIWRPQIIAKQNV